MMDVSKRGMILFLLVGSFLLISCTTENVSIAPEKKCSLDSDCVKATCCHAKDAVNKENAPDCKGMICTTECVPETADCGQGEIKCVYGECKVVLK